VAEKFPTKTKQVIAENALAASFLALRALIQVDEKFQDRSNLALTFSNSKSSESKLLKSGVGIGHLRALQLRHGMIQRKRDLRVSIA